MMMMMMPIFCSVLLHFANLTCHSPPFDLPYRLVSYKLFY
jgi:hypothetical protein